MVKELFEEYDGAGAHLARTRQQIGLSVMEVASHLRIREAYIRAIESGRYQELPGTAYALGFVRNYAQFLGLDPDGIVRQYRQESAWWRPRREFTAIEPTREENRPSHWLIGGALLVLMCVYGYWHVVFYEPNPDVVPMRAPEEVLRPNPPDPVLVEMLMTQQTVTLIPREGACPPEALGNRTLADAIAHCKILPGEYYTFLYQWLATHNPTDTQAKPQ